MAIADRQGHPVAVHVDSATPHEVTLVHATLAKRCCSASSQRVSSATTLTSRTDWLPNWHAMASN
jgi:hypothetical protein